MIPPGNFMVVAEVAPGREQALRASLAQMNTGPGRVDPLNRLVPFGRFEALHFARFAILADATRGDLAAHGAPAAELPTYLVFIGDCDGCGRRLLDEMAHVAQTGLREVFAHCVGFGAGTDLAQWLHAHDLPIAAAYANWPGRTVRRVREERDLAEALSRQARTLAGAEPGRLQAVRAQLLEFVAVERRSGRLLVSADPPTPARWWWRNLADLIGKPLLGLAMLPLALLASPALAWMLRSRECSDPEIAPPPRPEHVAELAEVEDRDITNAFTGLGSVKPGAFRRMLVTLLIMPLDYASRHVYNRGHLTRIQSIHFARWVFLDGKRRLFFASNYDGILDSYMDDFINKVAWGLNLVFSNGVGYPRTDWLVKGGARNAQAFKHYLRRHQVPTLVWYKAYPGLSAMDLARHGRIREGLDRPAMNDAEIEDWLRLM
ncbi:MAG: hypothetical protein ABW032_01950 [Burkholderiaceae bacterium]